MQYRYKQTCGLTVSGLSLFLFIFIHILGTVKQELIASFHFLASTSNGAVDGFTTPNLDGSTPLGAGNKLASISVIGRVFDMQFDILLTSFGRLLLFDKGVD